MDPILFWNDVALEANRVSFQSGGTNEQPGPALSSRALTIVHLAMYDAFAAVSGNPPATLPPYMTGLPAVPASSTTAAATAAAAYTTLVKLYPSQKAFFDLKLAEAGEILNAGHDFGVSVANMLLENRKNDPGVGSQDYFPATGIGKHKVDPDNPGQGFYAPFYGTRSPTFSVAVRHQLDTPPAVGDAKYNKSLEQVYVKGIAPELAGTLPPKIGTPPQTVEKRLAEETIIGVFWGYDGANLIGTPPRFYNQIIRAISMKLGLSAAQNARLFALVNTAMGDAGILAWTEKYRYEYWRPVVGIREAPTDPDTNWLPFGGASSNTYNPVTKVGTKNFTPNFPSYPSGHATFGAAAFTIAELYLNSIPKPVNFTQIKFVSDEYNGVNQDNKGAVRPKLERTMTGGFDQMIEENGFSRVWLGVHWSFDAFAVKNNGKPDLTKNIGGVPLGINIAKDIFTHGMVKSNLLP